MMAPGSMLEATAAGKTIPNGHGIAGRLQVHQASNDKRLLMYHSCMATTCSSSEVDNVEMAMPLRLDW
jgi:hypothetical protein